MSTLKQRVKDRTSEIALHQKRDAKEFRINVSTINQHLNEAKSSLNMLHSISSTLDTATKRISDDLLGTLKTQKLR